MLQPVLNASGAGPALGAGGVNDSFANMRNAGNMDATDGINYDTQSI